MGIVRAVPPRRKKTFALIPVISVIATLALPAGGAAKPRGPQVGYATLGYNLKHHFFYGTAKMPPAPDGDGYACLFGNRHFPDGPRLLRIYRALPGPDRAISPDIAASATPENGTLAWKFERKHVPTGRYYVVFEEKIPTAPYASSECAGFRSREGTLPQQRPTPTRSPRT